MSVTRAGVVTYDTPLAERVEMERYGGSYVTPSGRMERIMHLERRLATAMRRVRALRKARRDDQRHIAKLHQIVGSWRRAMML